MSTGLDQRRTVSRLALATAIVTLLAVLSLIIFYALGGPFGLINDAANGLIGMLSLALAWRWVRNRRSGLSTLGIAAAALIQPGQRVGLGSGKAAWAYVRALGKRVRDEKLDWNRISIDELNACYSSLSFFDAAGMRFHLPAFLIAELNGTYHQDMSLQLANLNDYTIAQYGLLSPAQRAAIRAYLQFMLGDPRYAFSHAQIKRALDEYWTDQL